MAMETLTLETSDGYKVVTPASLDSVTTYVLLEQETWFEKELPFLRHILRPGMTAIDIGANLGIFSLAMAKLVGPTGRVFAYEPASEPRTLLEQSRTLNGVENLEIISAALSDGEREGHLVFGQSSELNALGEGGAGERVRITSLDLEAAAHDWKLLDFIKIDAEGEEERVLAGGKELLAKHSPLVQFEVKAGAEVDMRLRNLLPQLGYNVYRLLVGAPILVPLKNDELDRHFEINLFAAKPDRAASLVQQGLLVGRVPEWSPKDESGEGLKLLLAQPCGALMTAAGIDANVSLDPDYAQCLDAYAVWRSSKAPLPERCGALAFAFRGLQALRAKGETASRMSTLARVAAEFGQRTACFETTSAILDALRQGAIKLNEPFWPATARFDTFSPPGQIGQWFAMATAETDEYARGFSSMFIDPSARVNWMAKHPLGKVEMERRRMLVAARAGEQPPITPRLCERAADHLNAGIWRTGKVPGIRLDV
jgi:FkbM family methyltransferase